MKFDIYVKNIKNVLIFFIFYFNGSLKGSLERNFVHLLNFHFYRV